MEPRSARRRCLLLLGAAALAGGRPVHEVEAELRRLGAALGEPDVQSAAAPTGIFVSLGDDEPAGFESVGPPLRFDQAAAVTRSASGCCRASSGRRRRSTRLRAVRAQPPRLPRWAAAAGLLPVAAGIALILQPAPANVARRAAVLAARGGADRARRALAAADRRCCRSSPPSRIGCLIFGAAEPAWLDGPLRTLLAPIAVLLPGALIVTGMSELAAGAMVAGSARLIFGTVQLLLFTFGVLAAARVLGPRPPSWPTCASTSSARGRRGWVCCWSASASTSTSARRAARCRGCSACWR